MSARDGSVIFCAVGDVLVDDLDPSAPFARVKSVFEEADILYGNCEGVYTDRTEHPPTTHWPANVAFRNIAGLEAAGFDVMCCANNHIVDSGHNALIEMIAALRERGIATSGAGKDVEEARAPAFVERNGTRFAFLSYCTSFPTGYQARTGVPGLASIRVDTAYRTDPDVNAPGRVPEIITIPWAQDMEMIRNDIAQARKSADVIIFSHHGRAGSYLTRITYERDIAHFAIDVGADVVLGHASHTLRGLDLYRGKPIFYDLGHFVFQLGDMRQRTPGSEALLTPTYPFEADGQPKLEAQLTAIARIVFRGSDIADVSWIPCKILQDGSVKTCDPASEEGQQIVNFVKARNEQSELQVDLIVRGSAVVFGASQAVAG